MQSEEVVTNIMEVEKLTAVYEAIATPANNYRNQIVMPVMDLAVAIERRKLLVAFTKTVMVPNRDFGIIPGTDKPALLKPGAEKLLNYFGLIPRFEIIDASRDFTGENHNGEPFFYYEIRCLIYDADRIVAEGFGSCNSFEKKFRYRNLKRRCPQCDAAAIMVNKYNGGFYCNPKQNGCGRKFHANEPGIISQEDGKIPNPDIADQANTILKIGKKRAFIDATLIAVNASEFFTQDMEEFADTDLQEISNGDPGGNGKSVKTVTEGKSNAKETVESDSKDSNNNQSIKEKKELLDKLHAQLEKLGLGNSIPAYHQYLLMRYKTNFITNITSEQIKEQMSLLAQCAKGKRKFKQLTDVLEKYKLAA